jgi:AraC-like DNA-binding protein
VAGPDWRPSRVELQSTDPLRIVSEATLASISSAAVETGRPVTSITFPRAFLARALGAERKTDAVSGAWLEHRPPSDFLDSLHLVIASSLEAARGDLAVAAEAAGLSVRSLQRRLTGLGVTYSQLVDRVRLHKAMEWLHDEGVKIIDVAFALGYSDPAHFTRAFRRWTSLTPVEYRHLKLAGDGPHAAVKRPLAVGPLRRRGWEARRAAGDDVAPPARSPSLSVVSAGSRGGAVGSLSRSQV